MSHVSACSSALGLGLELVYRRSSQQDPEVERETIILRLDITPVTVYKTPSRLGQSLTNTWKSCPLSPASLLTKVRS